MYKEEGRVRCPACQRDVAQVLELKKRESLVSGHLFQEGVETTEIGYPILNADGFCPGSYTRVK